MLVAPALSPVTIRNTKNDWQAIRHDYVVMGATREQAIQKYEVAASLFDHHAKNGDWVRLKQEIEEKVSARLKGLPTISPEVLAAVDAQWRQRYCELEQMAVYITRYMAAHDATMSPSELNRLTQAERNIVQMQRLLMGESTENVGLIDQAVEKVLGLVEQFVPAEDRERFNDAVTRVLGIPATAGLLPAPR